MTDDELIKQLEKATIEIDALKERVAQLEKFKSPLSLPNTMVLDHSFVKRALAIYGHVFVAGLMIALPIYCFIFLISFMAN